MLSGIIRLFQDAYIEFRRGSNTIRLQSPTTLTSNLIFRLPNTAGVAGQFIQTDGSGNLTFADGSSLSYKNPVRVASTTNITIATPPASIDGVTLAEGDRVLLKNQTTGSENGIYVFNGESSAMTRASDFDTSAEAVPSCIVPVQEGTVNADTLWMLTTNAPITLGTTALVFSAFPNLTGYARTYTTTFTSGGTTTITHNLNNRYPVYQLANDSTGEAYGTPDSITFTGVNAFDIDTTSFGNSITMRITVIG